MRLTTRLRRDPRAQAAPRLASAVVAAAVRASGGARPLHRERAAARRGPQSRRERRPRTHRWKASVVFFLLAGHVCGGLLLVLVTVAGRPSGWRAAPGATQSHADKALSLHRGDSPLQPPEGHNDRGPPCYDARARRAACVRYGGPAGLGGGARARGRPGRREEAGQAAERDVT